MLITFSLSQASSSHNSQNHVSSCFLRRKRLKLDRLTLATRNSSCDIILMLLWFKSLSREHFEILKSRVKQTSSSILRTCWWFFDSARKSLELWTKIVDKFERILWFDMLARWRSLDEIRKCIRVKNRLRCRQSFITRRRRDVMRNWQEQKRYCFWISRNGCEKMRQMYNFASKQFYDELNSNKRRDLVIASLLLLQNQQTKVRSLHLTSFLVQLLTTTWKFSKERSIATLLSAFIIELHDCLILAFENFQLITSKLFKSQTLKFFEQSFKVTQSWSRRERRTKRHDDCLSTHKRKWLTSNSMNEEVAPIAKRHTGSSNVALSFSSMIIFSISILNWRTRVSSRNQSRKGSFTREQLQELRATNSLVSLMNQFEESLSNRVVESLKTICGERRNEVISIELRVDVLWRLLSRWCAMTYIWSRHDWKQQLLKRYQVFSRSITVSMNNSTLRSWSVYEMTLFRCIHSEELLFVYTGWECLIWRDSQFNIALG